MTAREKALLRYLAISAIAAITFLNAVSALGKRAEAEEGRRRCELSAPVASRLAASIAEKERIIGDARSRLQTREATPRDAYALGEHAAGILRSAGVAVKGFTIISEGDTCAVQYSAKSDAAVLARFLDLAAIQSPRIAVTSLSVGSGNDGWLELSIRTEYGTSR